MSSDYERIMATQMMIQTFMTEVDVVMQAYADYDHHWLNLLAKAKYEQRVMRLHDLAEAYVNLSVEISDTEYRIEQMKERKKEDAVTIKDMIKVAKKKTKKKQNLATVAIYELALKERNKKWDTLLGFSRRWLGRLKTLLVKCEGQLSAFRDMGLVKAFEQFRTEMGQLTGVPAGKMGEIKDKADKDKKERKRKRFGKSKEEDKSDETKSDKSKKKT